MTHIAVQEAPNGKAVNWMEQVSDEQYRKQLFRLRQACSDCNRSKSLARRAELIHAVAQLIVSSGLAPVGEMLARGCRIAMGLDELGFDEDEDALYEMRLAYAMHKARGFDIRVPRAELLRCSKPKVVCIDLPELEAGLRAALRHAASSAADIRAAMPHMSAALAAHYEARFYCGYRGSGTPYSQRNTPPGDFATIAL